MNLSLPIAEAPAVAKDFSTKKSPPSARKIRGGYYTPPELAEYLCQWAIRSPSDRVIEPSCGDGAFVGAATRLLGEEGAVTAVEIVPEELEKARCATQGAQPSLDWQCASFFDVAPALLAQPCYDVVVGNPPFIRFQYFDKAARERAFCLLNAYGYRPSGLANAWIAFIQLAVEMLRDGGRLAMVVPAELLQVQYAAELRHRLPMLFDNVTVIAFDELVFPQIQQEVVLLLGEGRNRDADSYGKLHTRELANGQSLVSSTPVADAVSHLPERHTHEDMKWTSLFLDDGEFNLLRDAAALDSLDRLGKLADVDVGIVTGRNSFFVVTEDQAEHLGLNGRAVDVVGRTAALKSFRFTQEDMRRFGSSNRSKLIDLNGLDRSRFSPELEAYICQAEAAGVNDGYKCRIRNRWFDVPSVYAPDAFMFRQIHNAPLLVANRAQATATDTIHRVRTGRGINVDRLGASLVNSLTFAWAEVCGRSYGGGVLELEPREAEKLLIPYEFADGLDLEYMDGKLRAGELEAAMDHGDSVLLQNGCGLSQGDLLRARNAWNRLRQRRQRRK